MNLYFVFIVQTQRDLCAENLCEFSRTVFSSPSLGFAMGKRAAPKGEAAQAAKAKAKAKSSSTRSTSAKAQSMTEAELTEYRNLHSKLTYRSKVGMAGADEALHQVKCNRELVLEKFRGDKTMAWVPSS